MAEKQQSRFRRENARPESPDDSVPEASGELEAATVVTRILTQSPVWPGRPETPERKPESNNAHP